MKKVWVDVVVDRKSGGILPMVIGQPNDHISDWRGCNFRRAMLPGWTRGKRLERTDKNIAMLRALCRSVVGEKLSAVMLDVKGSSFSDYSDRYEYL